MSRPTAVCLALDAYTGTIFFDKRDRSRSILAALLRAEGNPDARSAEGDTALRCFAEKDPAMITLLLQRGADPNAANLFGDTPLMFAAQARNREAVRLLCAKAGRAGVNQADSDGETPLMWVLQGWEGDAAPVVETLLAAGADPLLRNKEGRSALDMALSCLSVQASTQEKRIVALIRAAACRQLARRP